MVRAWLGLGSVETVCDLEQCDSRLLINPEEVQQYPFTEHCLIHMNSLLIHVSRSLNPFDRRSLPKHSHSHRLSSFLTADPG